MDMALGRELLDSRLQLAAPLSEWTVIAIEISGTSTAIERIAYLFGSSPKQTTQVTADL